MFEAENAPWPRRGCLYYHRKFLTGHPYAGLRRMMRERFSHRIEVIDVARRPCAAANGPGVGQRSGRLQ
jgi:hypothetical protein